MQTTLHPARTTADALSRLQLVKMGLFDVGMRRQSMIGSGRAVACGDESFLADRMHFNASNAAQHSRVVGAELSSPSHRLTRIAAA